MRRLALMIGLLMSVASSPVLASPCTDDCLQGGIDGLVGCTEALSGGQYGSDSIYAISQFNLCLAASQIAMSACINNCLGEPYTGEGPDAITTHSTPGNQRCFTTGQPIQLQVGILSNCGDPVASMDFYLYVDSLTPPILLATDNTPTNGFSLTYLPTTLGPGRYYIAFVYRGAAPLQRFLGANVFWFDLGTCVLGADTPQASSDGLALAAPWPNPAARLTNVRFQLASAAAVRIEVFDVAGRRVALLSDGRWMEAGEHQAAWDGRTASGRRAARGLYQVRVSTDDALAVRRVVRLE